MRLIDADANIETMKKCAKNPENEQALLCYRYAQRILEEAPTVEPPSPWHSMEDNGPPEENGPYFVYAPSYRGGSSSGKEIARGVMISKWTGKHWSIEVGYYKRPGCVTHWMPIEPPQEEA